MKALVEWVKWAIYFRGIREFKIEKLKEKKLFDYGIGRTSLPPTNHDSPKSIYDSWK